MTAVVDDTTSVLFSGVGGQGVLLASDVLAEAALAAGHDVKKSEVHGMSQRGGAVVSHVRFGARVHSPLIPEGAADVLLAMEQLEALRWLHAVGPQGVVIAADTRVVPAPLENYPPWVEEELLRLRPDTVLVDTKALTPAIGGARYLNIALLGVLARHLDLPPHAWRQAIETKVPPRHRESNLSAFQAGREADNQTASSSS